jgi:uncharacterized protein YutE (UPF0331/DUF86 family)
MSPGQLDEALVRRHLLALDAALTHLRRHAGRPLADLERDLDEVWVVEHGLQLCAQNVLDIATHVAAAAGRDAPDYAAAIDALGELGVVPPEFAARIRALAGLRNLLVHGYLAVDLTRLHALLNERLADLAEFARHVQGYLER